MSLSNVTEEALLALIFNATAWANYADDAAASPQTSIAVALHTASPGDDGSMATNEIVYEDYARVDVARSAGGWTVSGSVCNPVSAITFPEGGPTGSGIATAFSTGKTGGGGTAILFAGSIIPQIPCGNGVTPTLATSTEIILD